MYGTFQPLKTTKLYARLDLFFLFYSEQDESPFQLQITASIRERPLRGTWATIAAPTMPAAVVQEPTLLFVTEKGFNKI